AEKAAAIGEVPVGAVLVKDGQIIARAFNVREKLESPISHAEIHALIAGSQSLGSWRLTDCELYVTLEPCLMCLGAMVQARIKKCVYGAVDPKGGALSLGYRFNEDVRLNHRFPIEHVSHDRSSSILSEFFRARRRSTKS
ncbi:MAG: nucleoside deaminase, partial [Proteobacteria bacterium]